MRFYTKRLASIGSVRSHKCVLASPLHHGSVTSPRSPHHNRAKTQLEIPTLDAPPATLDDSPAWCAWRPVGWRGGATPEATYLPGRAAEEKAKRGVTLDLAEEIALHNLALLRDCYNTPAWVWEIASALAEVGEWETDPFWNPSAVGAAALTSLKLDGSEGRDGLATDSTGAPLWRGPTLVNGPHSDPAAWVRLCPIHGRDNPVAAVVPCDGVKWYREIGLSADLEVALGRLNYEAPPGLPPRQSSPRASSLLLWVPHLRNEIRTARRFAEPIAWRINHAPRKPVVIVRRAFAGTVDVFDWISAPVTVSP